VRYVVDIPGRNIRSLIAIPFEGENHEGMTLVRAGLAEGFYFGEDAVLLAFDTDGVSTFLAGLTQAEQEGASRLGLDGTIHEFLIEGSASDIEFHDDDDTVVWRLGGAKAQEIIELLTDMHDLHIAHVAVERACNQPCPSACSGISKLPPTP
jgi:hypothetical protein